MKITTENVASLNPCASRLQNFKDHYPNFSGSVQDFLSLDNITYSDKVWVCVRLMTRNQKFYWARACAFSVLEIFEAKHPDDRRVRDLLDFLNKIENIETLTVKNIEELRQLRIAAATAVGSAAFATAYVAFTAADACAATACAGAFVDACTATVDANGRLIQEELNLILLKEIMELDV